MPATPLTTPNTADLRDYEQNGFLILREFFGPNEIALLAEEADSLLSRVELISRHNLRCRFMPHCETGQLLFEVFDPVLDIAPVAAEFARNDRLLHLIETLYGEPACLFKDKLIFKPAGATGYPLHQDIPLTWVGFPRSFLTVLIPIDSQSEQNGCTEVFSGYHGSFLSGDGDQYMLPDNAVDVSRATPLVLEPGDIAVFHGLTPHRSQPNRSNSMRRSLFLSFNALSDGGDQRAAHYDEFQTRMRQRFLDEEQADVHFR